MKTYSVHNWNDYSKELTMIILNESDIKNTKTLFGFGFEIVILPKKYENVSGNEFLDNIIHLALARGGEIIYI